MGIIEDLQALSVDPTNARAVATAIATLAAGPAGRTKLLQEWQAATGLHPPTDLINELLGPPAETTEENP